MKSLTAGLSLLALLGFALYTTDVAAQGETTTVPNRPPAVYVAQPHLSPGASEVLKLTQAQVGDETVIAYITNSGLNYNLSASDIVYLRGQGVSDGVLTAMLQNHPKTVSAVAPAEANTLNNSQVAPTYAPAANSPQSPPVQSSPSTTYVISSPAPTYYYPYPTYYPYYGTYYGSAFPALSFSFGFGNWGGGYHHYGYHGGGYHGHGHH